MAHGTGPAGDTCTKRQTHNRDKKRALYSNSGTGTGDRRNQAGCRGSPQSVHVDDRAHAKLMTTWLKTFAHRNSRKDASSFGFTLSELRRLRSLKTPAGVQKFLDELPYNLSYTARSPKEVLEDRTASCLEGGIFAAAGLRVLGFPPLIFDLEAEQDTDHVVAIFKVRGHWGAVAKSNFTGCRYREPVYRSLRELAMSYFNIYFNLRGERTLRRYSRPVNLARFDRLHWMTTRSE